MISHKHKCIFVHIPKTAGGSINKTLGMPKGREIDEERGIFKTHATARQIKDYYHPEEFGRYFKFTIVRNPFDRLVSAYAYLNKRTGVKGTFWEYVTRTGVYADMASKTPSTEDILINLRPQVEFLFDGDLLVDYIGRFENLDRAWGDICALTGINVPLVDKKYNRSSHDRYQKYYTGEIKEMVAERYKEDLEVFRYAS